jgi:shikimate dehydrogenase
MSPAKTRLGVLGWPVSHSRSPQMQNAALQAVGLTDWRYQLLPAPPELFKPLVEALVAVGFAGVNVTIPHKHAALALAHEVGAEAGAIGAANTLLFQGGAIRAENTDGPGLLQALPLSPRGMSALVLGAGGSARAAVWALQSAGAADVLVWNRTPERARELCQSLGATWVPAPRAADLLVNCTPGVMDAHNFGLKSAPRLADEIAMFRCVVDFAYGADESPLVRAGRLAGVPVVDGLELLLAQGALSFQQFTGRRAPLDVMRAAVSRHG